MRALAALGLAALGAAAAACSRPPADAARPASSAPAAASAPAPSAVASVAPLASAIPTVIPLASAKPASSAPPDPPEPPPVPHLSYEDDPSTGAVSAEKWLKARNVTSHPRTDLLSGCAITKLGAPPREGLVCDQQPPMAGSLTSGESLFGLTLWVVEGRALRQVLEVPIAAGPLDREGPPSAGDPHRGNYVTLEHALDPSGTRIEVREHADPAASCKAAIAGMPKDAPNILRVMRIACAATGVYTWQNNRFVRTGAPTPRASGAAPPPTTPMPPPPMIPGMRGATTGF